VFNVLNRDNFGCYSTGNRNDADFGKPTCVVSDMRRYQLGADYKFWVLGAGCCVLEASTWHLAPST